MNAPVVLLTREVEMPPAAVRAYATARLGEALRRAGISAQFTLATAAEVWSDVFPSLSNPRLGLVWTTRTGCACETRACFRDLLVNDEPPLPFDFLGSLPHMAALYAASGLPGFAGATNLVGATHALDPLLGALGSRRDWTHVLVGEVATPEAGLFHARWEVLACG